MSQDAPPRRRRPGLVRPYAADPPITPTGPQLRGDRWDFGPYAPWICVAWGDYPAYALAARIRADAYAAVNALPVVDRVASYGQDPTTERLLTLAELCAYARHGGEGWAWWLVSSRDVRLADVDRIKARQYQAWSQARRPRPPDRLPLALEPVSYQRTAP